MLPIVDAHLDLAWNTLNGRDLTLTVDALRAQERRTSQQIMATLPELAAGGIAIVFGTLYVGAKGFDDEGAGIYETPPDEDARNQLAVYRRWESEGRVRIITGRASLESHLDAWLDDAVTGVVLLIEGGDSITTPDDLDEWWDAGVRVIGPAWTKTRYCGGTRAPGPLTALGRDLLAKMKERGVILDVSHMAEQSFWDAMEAGFHRVAATHANVRSFVGEKIADRHLSDDMLAALGDADGMVGVVPANRFLTEEAEVTMGTVKKHLDHIASIVGWHRVGIGSDLDGGFGLEETPAGMDTAADLRKIADLVPPDAAEGVLGGNWLRVLRESLPD